MKAQYYIYSNVGLGGIFCRLSSLCFADAASIRGFAPIEKRKFLQKFFVDFFSKKSIPMNCSPFFSWCGSFLCVTTKKRSYFLCNYLLYLLSYYFTSYIYTPLSVRGLTMRGNRLPAYLQAVFVASDSARKSPACVFAGDFRSAKGIGDRRFNFILNVCDEVGKPGRFTDSPKKNKK